MSPRPIERLGKTLARVAKEHGLTPERLRRWGSFLALCGVLERAVPEGVLDNYYLKGGVAMELRFAENACAGRALARPLQHRQAHSSLGYKPSAPIAWLPHAIDYGNESYHLPADRPRYS
jgi:hypothetical protein